MQKQSVLCRYVFSFPLDDFTFCAFGLFLLPGFGFGCSLTFSLVAKFMLRSNEGFVELKMRIGRGIDIFDIMNAIKW
jgi:hypothetical protein